MNQPDTYMLEIRILGSLLDSGDIPDLEPSDFHVEEFSLLFATARQYAQAHGGKCDYVLLGEHLLQTHGMDKRDWLKSIAGEKVPREELLDKYVDALKARHDRKSVSEALYELADRSSMADAGEAREEAMQRLRELHVRKQDRIVTAESALRDSVATLDRLFTQKGMPGIDTGMARLNRKLGGWQKSDLVLLAARPSIGKTALMCNFVLNAPANTRIGIVSTEQPAEQIANRLVAINGRLPLWKFRAPRNFTDSEWPMLSASVEDIAKSPIFIMDDTRPSVGDIERQIRDRPLDLIFVDYAQRLKASGDIYTRVSAIAHGLKDLARNHEIPVVALAQINRQGHGGATMAHLKGSGDLEQEADQILILERGESENTATLTLEKNRHGPTGKIDLLWDAPCIRFTEMEGYDHA